MISSAAARDSRPWEGKKGKCKRKWERRERGREGDLTRLDAIGAAYNPSGLFVDASMATVDQDNETK